MHNSVHRLRADCSPLSTGVLNSCFRRVKIPDAVTIQFDFLKMSMVELARKLMAHAQKPHFVFGLNGRVHLNRRGSQFNRLLAAEVRASALVMVDTPRCEVV